MSSDQNPQLHEDFDEAWNKDPISANQDFMECQPIRVLVTVVQNSGGTTDLDG